MLPNTQIKKLMKLLSIKEEKNAVFFISRLQGWIEKNGNYKNSILKGINVILQDIHNNEIKEAEKIKEINLSGIKHPVLIKYGKEILKLHQEGFGVRRIQKWLWEAHRSKISHSSIYNYILKQKMQ